MKILLTNNEIYNITLALNSSFGEEALLELPVMVNYNIQKNLKVLMDLSATIGEARAFIGKKYGTLEEDGGAYKISKENLEQAQQEMNKLMFAEELVEIKKIKLIDLKDIKLTSAQMAALLFMIEEE